MRSWGSQQSLGDVRVLLHDVDPTAIAAALTWVRTAIADVLVNVDAWLQDNPTHPQRNDYIEFRAEHITLRDQFARGDTLGTYYDVIRSLPKTRRELSRYLGRRLGPQPAWTIDPNHPVNSAFTRAGTVMRNAFVQVNAWLQANPTHWLHADVTGDNGYLIQGLGWLDVAYDLDDIDDVIRHFERTRRDLSRSMGQWLGAAPEWRAEPNHPNTIAVTEATTGINHGLVQVDAWLQVNPTHPLHAPVTEFRDDVNTLFGALDMAFDHDDINDVTNSLLESFWSLGRLLGWQVGPVPTWRADPNHRDTIAVTRAETMFADVLAQVDAWLQINPTHSLHARVAGGRDDLIDLHRSLAAVHTSGHIHEVISSLQETRRSLSRAMGQYFGPVPVWRAEPNDPNTIAVTEATTVIDGVLGQVDGWLQENPTHPHHAEVTTHRADLITHRGWFALAHDKDDIEDITRLVPLIYWWLGRSMGWRVAPLPEWRADPDDLNTIAVTQATTVIDGVLAQVDAWLQDNSTHPDHPAVTGHRADLMTHLVRFDLADTSGDINLAIDRHLSRTLIAVSDVLGPLGQEPLAWHNAVQGLSNGLTAQEWLTALSAATTRVLALRPEVRKEARTRASAFVDDVIRARDTAAVSEGRASSPVLAGWLKAAVIDTVAWTLIDDPNNPSAREFTPRDRVFVILLLTDGGVALRETQRPPVGAPSAANGDSVVEDSVDSVVGDSVDSDEESSEDSDADDEDAAGDEPVALRAVGALLGHVGDEPLAWYNAVRAPLSGLTAQEWLSALGAGTARVLALP
ncbi:MAG: hypothetical protein ACRYF3_17025, partial [Janthinobacterium lividum]